MTLRSSGFSAVGLSVFMCILGGSVLRSTGVALAQTPEGSATSQATSLASLPRITLAFTQQGEIPGVSASPLVALPLLCSGTGFPLITVPEEPDYRERAILSLDPKRPFTISYKSVKELHDIHYINVFPGVDGFLVLVNATRDAKQSAYIAMSQSGKELSHGIGFRGEHHDFLLKFNNSGEYKETLELPGQFTFHRIAELKDGSLVAIAYDRSNAVARLVWLSKDLSSVRELNIPSAWEQNPELQKGTHGEEVNRAAAETSLSWWMFAPVRGRVLLYRAHTADPVLEISEGGSLREVPVAYPDGYVLAAVIPSDHRWLFRLSQSGGSQPGVQHDAGQSYSVMVEANMNDGSLTRQFQLSSGPSYGIACDNEGVLTGISLGPGSKYLIYSADGH